MLYLLLAMKNKKKVIDPLPDTFSSEHEAAEFWDSHSAADYLECLEPTDDKISIEKRVFEVQVSEDIFNHLRKQAESSHQSLPTTVDRILRKELSLT
jgi:hypothetical protein